MKKINCFSKILFLILCICLQSAGQDTRSVSLRKITQDNGLSSYYITKIIQTGNGFLWAGTQDGLNCFDGMAFKIYNAQAEDKYRIGSNFISDLFEDKKRNILWVASSYGGVAGIDLTTLSVIKRVIYSPSGKNLSENWIRSITVQDDILWIGISGGIFAYSITDNKYLSVNKNNSPTLDLNNLNVSRVFSIDQKKVYFLCDDFGIVSITTDKLDISQIISSRQLNSSSNQSKLRFWNVAIDSNKTYLATSWGLRILEKFPTELKLSREQINIPEIFNKEVFSCAIDNSKKLWLSTASHFYSLDPKSNKLENFEEEKKDVEDWFSFVYQVYCGSNDMIWIGTQEGLASFNSNHAPFTSYFVSSISDTKIKHAFALLPVADSIVYCGDENGVYYVNLKTRRIDKIDQSGLNYMIFRSNKNEIFVSGANGLRFINGVSISSATSKYPELARLNFDLLHSAVQINDSLIIFGSVLQKGLHVWNTNRRTLTTYHNDSIRNQIKGLNVISNLYKSKSGELFIITDQSIIKFNPNLNQQQVFEIHAAGTKFSNFMDMCETDSSYWIASYGNGVIETDKNFNFKRVITSKKGLPNDAVYKVFYAEDNLIFASTNNGLAIINKLTGKTKNYFQTDGLHSNSFEQVCGFQTPERIYAGGVNGFTIIDPKKLSSNSVAPILYFNNIQIKTRYELIDTINLAIKTIDIPSDALQTTLYFSTLNYSNPIRSTIAYKINEQESDWIELGNTNSIPLIGFSPGTYHLQVQAFNEDGVPSEIKEITLVFLPKWYQTWWFKILIAFAVALIFYGLYRIRINHLRKEEKIRNQVASDLHDELGSTLNSVKVFANLAMIEKNNTSHLEKIKEATQSAIAGVKDIIWVLDDKRDTIDHLLTRINQFAKPLCEAAGISYNQQSGVNEDHKLGKEEKRNLYMIIKESINNSIKYSDCTMIGLLIKNKAGKLNITISDNGRGFDKEKITGGYGLKNILHRSEETGYNATISSSPGNGTLIYLEKK